MTINHTNYYNLIKIFKKCVMILSLNRGDLVITKLSASIARFFVASKAVEGEDAEVYQYGVEMILSTFCGFLSTLLLTCFFGDWYALIIFYAFFIPLRMNAGGYHANSYGGCFLVTTVVYAMYLLVGTLVPPNIAIILTCTLCIATLVIVFLLAPMIHKNSVIDEKGIIRRKILSRIIIIADCMIIYTLVAFSCIYTIPFYIFLAVGAVAISMIIEFIQKRGLDL